MSQSWIQLCNLSCTHAHTHTHTHTYKHTHMNNFAVYLKLTYFKSTILQLKKKNLRKTVFIESREMHRLNSRSKKCNELYIQMCTTQ